MVALNPTQLATFKTHLDANTDPVIVQALQDGTNIVIADWYNGVASPDVWVFKSSVTAKELRDAFDWNEVLTGSPINDLSRWGFDNLLKEGSVDPSLVNTRNALNQIFTGQSTTKLNVLNASTRKASIIESLFIQTATGPGGGDGTTQMGSAIADFEGDISRLDVAAALKL